MEDEGSVVGSSVEELTRRQTAFRAVNESIANLTALLNPTGYNLFICECSVAGCADTLEITPEEYEAVRAEGARFVVVPGHELTEIERVVGGNGRFLVVEKLGVAGEIARAEAAGRQ